MTEPRKVAVVTGGASGIGFGIATQLGGRGFSVVVADKNAEELRDAGARLGDAGVDIITFECDVRQPESTAALAQAVADRRGPIDLLCANAGVSGPPTGLVWTSRPEDWDRVYAVNVFGIVNTLRAFLPNMVAEARGQILVTGSITSFVSNQVAAAIYLSSKHAVYSVVDSVRAQLEAIGSPVKVQFLAPGGVATRIMEHEAADAELLYGSGAPAPEPVMQKLELASTGDRLQPEEIAKIALDALDTDRFIIFTHSNSRERLMASLQPFVSTIDALR